MHASGVRHGEACLWANAKDDKIESIDKAIDRLVYELSPDEINIIEGKEWSCVKLP